MQTEYAEKIELYKTLIDNVPGCIALVLRKRTREIVAANELARQIGAIPGDVCFERCSLIDTPCHWCLAPELWEADEPQKTEIAHQGKWYEGVWAPLSEEFYVHYIFDITERKQAEIDFQEQKRLLEKSQELSHIGSWQLDILENILRWTDENCRIFGVPPGSHADYELFLSKVHPEDRDFVDREWKLAMQGKPYDIEHRILVDGATRWVREKADVNFNDQGVAISATGFTQDITERVEQKKRQKSLEEQLHQSQKIESVGRLAGGVAHDYNNMLGVIIGYSELAQMKLDDSHDVQEDLREILSAARRSRDITHQLLAFARKQLIKPEVLDLNVRVEGTLKMLRNLLGENIDLVWKPKENLWPVEIDPTQFDQILANLCINARDAIDDVGKMTIETGTSHIDRAYCDIHPDFIPGDFVVLTVSDDGCGMSKEALEHIFEPFFTTKKTGEGTGLGLATVYGIVKQSSGFINVYSEVGKGTTFKIYLPRHAGVVSEKTEAPAKNLMLGQGETIVLVEDEPAIRRLSETMLTDLGYRVLVAETPSAALAFAEHQPDEIDLLITDVVMPEMNGRQLAEEMAKLRPGLRCLYMSGYTENTIAHHGVLDKGIHFIPKPFSATDFSKKIREALGEKS